MNKLLKGSIAGAAGVALLLGGAGTFALWNDTATIGANTIVAGQLDVADSGTAGVWKSGTTVINIAAYDTVPGDSLTFSKTMSVTAIGDNLVATLGVSAASITAATASTADVALANYLTENAQLTASGTGIVAVAGTGGASPTYTITAGAAGVTTTVTVDVTINFPKNATAGFENDSKLGKVSLDQLVLTLTQN